MHRWFRFCGMIALMGYATGGTFLVPSLQAQKQSHTKAKAKAHPSPPATPAPEKAAEAAETEQHEAAEAPEAAASEPIEPETAASLPTPSPLPTPGKHQLRVSPLQLLQHRTEEQDKQLEAQKALITGLTHQLEEQKKAIEALKEQGESLKTDISVLDGQVSNLSDNIEDLQAQNSDPAPSASISPSSAQAHTGANNAQKQPASTHSPFAESRKLPTQLDAISGSEDESEPAAPHTGPFHIVERGENLTIIAKKYGTTVSDILKLNKIRDERKLQIGQKLAIPGPTPTPEEQAPAAP